MAKLSRRSISRRTVEALSVEKDTVFWDRDLSGFGVRIYASGTKMYIVQSRANGKSVRVTVGRHGVISADEASRRAARIVNRIKAGEDPVPEPLPARLAGGPAAADLAARYMGGACGGVLQGVYGSGHPEAARKAHSSRVRKTTPFGGRARTGGSVSRPAARSARGGEPSGGAAVAHVHHGRVLGDGSRRHEPVSGGRPTRATQARAVPDRCGVPPPRRGARPRLYHGRSIGPCGSGNPVVVAYRLP